ncbi:hypothetical protein [Rheinheimera texasensis]|uniref:hypothetical protein n=1 Tax=Rheinheimera texasensis TaxID=306205 RepID=UPI0004E10D3E|nr:hypothetical protein [Rheinheimera texasensis]
MNRSYLTGFIPLFIVTSAQISAADWEQAHHEVSTVAGVQSSNNLFNTAVQQLQDQHLYAGLNWDWLGLFEGFGVQWPLQVRRRQYLDQTNLNATLYQLQPELRLFLTPQTDLALQATLNKQQFLAGDDAAEFLSPEAGALDETQQGMQAALSFGRAPDTQNLQVKLATEQRRQKVQDHLYSQLDSDLAELNYSHKWNENVALVLDIARRQEQQNQRDSDVNQYGAGIAVQWTGQQYFRLTGGRFVRSFAGQQLDDATGSYWQLNNLWQLDSRWQLELQSGRRSVLSYASQSISQLDTEHLAAVRWQYDQSHQFAAQVNRLVSRLDQSNYRRTRDAIGASWQWQWAQQWRSVLQVSQVQQSREQQPDRNRLEVAAEVSWAW